jgi:hypothetical protein
VTASQPVTRPPRHRRRHRATLTPKLPRADRRGDQEGDGLPRHPRTRRLIQICIRTARPGSISFAGCLRPDRSPWVFSGQKRSVPYLQKRDTRSTMLAAFAQRPISARSVGRHIGVNAHTSASRTGGSPLLSAPDLYPCCWSTVVRVEGRATFTRSYPPYVSGDGAPANRFAAAIR